MPRRFPSVQPTRACSHPSRRERLWRLRLPHHIENPPSPPPRGSRKKGLEEKASCESSSQGMYVAETVSLSSVFINLSSQATLSVVGSQSAEFIASTASTSPMESSSSFTI